MIMKNDILRVISNTAIRFFIQRESERSSYDVEPYLCNVCNKSAASRSRCQKKLMLNSGSWHSSNIVIQRQSYVYLQ